MKGKVLITGGCGFIGSVMVKLLLKKGFEVRAIDLPIQISKTPPPKEAEIYAGSILDLNDVINAAQSCDYVVHFAAMMGVGNVEIKRLACLNLNIQGTINILEACVRDNIKKTIFISSSEVYGDQAAMPISERAPLNPKSIYAITKLAGEEYVKAYNKRYDIDYSILRLFNVYGPEQVDAFVVPRFVKLVMGDKPPTIYGEGDQLRAFCYVDDAVMGTALALMNEKANSEIFNIGNDKEPISIRDLAIKIISMSKRNLKPVYVDFADSDRSEEREIQKRIPDISKARRVLGYEPKVSLSEGIRRVMEQAEAIESWPDPTKRNFA